MHFIRTPAALLLATCLAQVLAHPGGGDDIYGLLVRRNRGGDGYGGPGTDSAFGGGDQQRNRDGTYNTDGNRRADSTGNGNVQGQVSVETVTLTATVTTQIAAAGETATPLTVMTVTVTAPCVAPPPAAAGDPNAVATSVIAAPTAPGSVRKFVTPAASIQQGLTSLPVQVASALGADPAALSSPSPPSPPAASVTSSTSASAAPVAGSVTIITPPQAGVKFTTNGIVAGKTSVATELQNPSLPTSPP